jgi:hypothetical protein
MTRDIFSSPAKKKTDNKTAGGPPGSAAFQALAKKLAQITGVPVKHIDIGSNHGAFVFYLPPDVDTDKFLDRFTVIRARTGVAKQEMPLGDKPYNPTLSHPHGSFFIAIPADKFVQGAENLCARLRAQQKQFHELARAHGMSPPGPDDDGPAAMDKPRAPAKR